MNQKASFPCPRLSSTASVQLQRRDSRRAHGHKSVQSKKVYSRKGAGRDDNRMEMEPRETPIRRRGDQGSKERTSD